MSAGDTVTTFFIALLVFTLFFWGWAVLNTIGMSDGDYDLGIISFATVLMTSCYVIGMRSADAVPARGIPRHIITISHLLVAINYYLPFVMGDDNPFDTPGLAIYFAVFTLLWIFIAWYARQLIYKAEEM